jgi:hypothetical protein
MKLSRIVKSAYRRAVKAGFIGSLKQWADQRSDEHTDQWFTHKAEQSKQSSRRGHHVVHTQQHSRSVSNTLASNVLMRDGGGRS